MSKKTAVSGRVRRFVTLSTNQTKWFVRAGTVAPRTNYAVTSPLLYAMGPRLRESSGTLKPCREKFGGNEQAVARQPRACADTPKIYETTTRHRHATGCR